jgi:cytoskeleton protein RodZ
MSSRDSRQTADVRDTRADQLRRIGGALREARQARGEDLYAVAETLRIKPSYLSALEEGDLSMTPGRPYALGFLRSYADHLGFDGAEVVRLVKETFDGAPPHPELVVPRAERADRRPHGVLIAASILLLGVLYGSWHMLWRDQPVLERVAAVPGELGRLAGEMLAGPPSLPTPTEARAPVPRPTTPAAVPRTAPAPAASEERPQLQALLAPEPAEPVRLPPPIASGRDTTGALAAERPAPRAPDGPSPAALLAALDADRGRPPRDTSGDAADARVVLVARESAWVQIRSAGRDYVRTRTLEPGDRLVLPDRDDLALWTGNAGGIEVVVEGEKLGVLGESGKVLRDVPLAPGSLRARLGRP